MEVNINFKNVGQGDTILFNWMDNQWEKPKYGLIDCNLTPNYQIKPITDYIDKEKIEVFDFVILTHPHTDHFSGFLKFLNYCKKKNIIIKRFYHTAFLAPQFLSQLFNKEIENESFVEEKLTASVIMQEDKNKLATLFHYLLDQEKLNGAGFIKSVQNIGFDFPIVVNNYFNIRLLSPNENFETAEYLSKTYDIKKDQMLSFEQKNDNNPHANYLASFLQIYSDVGNWQVLLCSDVNKESLDRIKLNKDIYDDLKKRRLIYLQIPHHGSSRNHFSEFWDEFAIIDGCEAVISAGETYGHPGIQTIEYFANRLNNKLHCTNFVGGYREFYSNNSSSLVRQVDSIFDIPGVYPQEIEVILNEHNIKCPKCCGKRLFINMSDTENHSWQLFDEE